MYYDDDTYDTSSNIYRSLVDKYAPLKLKKVRANQIPLMTK